MGYDMVWDMRCIAHPCDSCDFVRRMTHEVDSDNSCCAAHVNDMHARAHARLCVCVCVNSHVRHGSVLRCRRCRCRAQSMSLTQGGRQAGRQVGRQAGRAARARTHSRTCCKMRCCPVCGGMECRRERRVRYDRDRPCQITDTTL